MKLKVLQLVFLGLVFGTVGARAFPVDSTQGKADFSQVVKQLSDACGESNCQPPFSRRIVYRYGEGSKLKPELQQRLEQLAFDQAQVWADTILEGDYEAQGPTQLDQVAIFYEAGKEVGYLITYSERAWDVSDCVYDGISQDQLQNCLQGRIVESSYVSKTLQDVIVDEKNMSTFYPDIL
ncbi:hypothetical protein [Pseudobdellovibrio exovorus]|uniref:Uncharacterized protein n=1 Tax=Pseudobdellovibrio exovorus JSS TaxID=1184267 RepID=M4VP62_9BACT|nr:hypothetical protein [Pseudobdellovibrio exovorus]AGH94919.1 hypothetical protein A11Q_699 [Pseudobdellovibrio exovorus JSS]